MAILKDYYRILSVKSSASAGEIKYAYRKMAMAYHPDRNADDALAAAIFADAAEAYKVLSNTETRKQYNYERHLTAAQEYNRPVETIETLLERMQKINALVKQSDPFRFNKSALLYSIRQLFPDDIALLLNTNNNLLKQFLEIISATAQYLSSFQTKQLIVLLQPFYGKHEWLQHRLNTLLHQQQTEERWEKYKVVLALLVAVVLCLIIFLVASK